MNRKGRLRKVWIRVGKTKEAVFKHNDCTVILLSDSFRHRPEEDAIMLERLRAKRHRRSSQIALVSQVSRVWRYVVFAWHERLDQVLH